MKITRKQADKITSALDAVIVCIRAQMTAMNDMPITESLTDAWNLLHDQVRELESEKASVEQAYSRRNWTGADYTTHELISNNVD